MSPVGYGTVDLQLRKHGVGLPFEGRLSQASDEFLVLVAWVGVGWLAARLVWLFG